MESQKDKTIPAEGIRHASGMTRSTSEFEDEDSGKPHTHRRRYFDSPVGGITVTASVRVQRLMVTEDGPDPFLEMELVVKADDTLDQPDTWSVSRYHYADVIMDGLEEYLKKYCPAPDQVLETLMSFDYARK